jgi:hypothetical protein
MWLCVPLFNYRYLLNDPDEAVTRKCNDNFPPLKDKQFAAVLDTKSEQN